MPGKQDHPNEDVAQASGPWAATHWLITKSQLIHTRTALIWALIAALWVDWLVTAVALLFGNAIHELNPLGLALYQNLGVFGLAGLKAWTSLLLLVIAGWIRPPRAVRVLQLTLGFYTLILVWNGLQLVLFL
jgi:hypothetical protein